ncbi:4-hydroxythreonine-4-phosphate dehydrogenase [Helicobacter marmotae]|uniref:4-hydroxythreonine-4-phosphate dehydrogenase n=1 Tax=Helicobacter marmotae TaxID=152490 RepID=A0A3D8I7K8_9HELI|nr:4-hydroxythreonine-4-phosphate dehydrogenase [Helicobacter marmotae]RDU61097.1 4-hydroxythreonine-4-phosphate dehydrogenase [Helicobacter marmotae]
MPKIAISIGDVNGIGLEIAIRAHKEVSKYCQPLYCVHKEVLYQASQLLNLPLALDMQCVGDFEYQGDNLIEPGCVSAKSGDYSYKSFMQALKLTQNAETAALVTLPIHKKAWQEAGVKFVGHTDALSSYFEKEAIMMLGCKELFVALFTDHIALREVAQRIDRVRLVGFLLDFARALDLKQPCCVLGLNPHCGDGGIMGDEDEVIRQAIKEANHILNKELFLGPYPPDSAFSPFNRSKFAYYVSMYHDVGLAPLKALYFEQSINVSLNLPILRTSVDHGVAFDKAYKGGNLSIQSYLNALHYAITHINSKHINC